ncbi:MAG: hypothetical protein BAJALOKI2v1_960002 [Promethearchaeota archaeon]|nr:MAG: hypothetical protein BAJALOKI2v1_960002 [Candidatus Lokiarchaeota archaeon]
MIQREVLERQDEVVFPRDPMDEVHFVIGGFAIFHSHFFFSKFRYCYSSLRTVLYKEKFW